MKYLHVPATGCSIRRDATCFLVVRRGVICVRMAAAQPRVRILELMEWRASEIRCSATDWMRSTWVVWSGVEWRLQRGVSGENKSREIGCCRADGAGRSVGRAVVATSDGRRVARSLAEHERDLNEASPTHRRGFSISAATVRGQIRGVVGRLSLIHI